MKRFGFEDLKLLRVAMMEGFFGCFANPFYCSYVLNGKFCPLKESCLARASEAIGFKQPNEDPSEMWNKIHFYFER